MKYPNEFAYNFANGKKVFIMKKIFLSFFIILALSGTEVAACPICGCGVGGFYIGLLPSYKSQFIGVRYLYSNYETHLKDDASEFSFDHYHQLEVYGGVTLGKWQLLGFIPYHINHQLTDDRIINRNGIGDITLLANYNLWQSDKLTKNNTSVSQGLWLGAGIKLPTGKYSVDFSDSVNDELDELLGDVNSQMGTGSTDIILNAMYNISFGKAGINSTANYKINTTNNNHFRYGDRFSFNSFAYYQLSAGKKINLAPNIGMLYQYTSQNALFDDKVKETGGYVLATSAGVDVNFKKITIGTNIQLPVAQNYAHGQTVEKVGGLVHVTYTF